MTLHMRKALKSKHEKSYHFIEASNKSLTSNSIHELRMTSMWIDVISAIIDYQRLKMNGLGVLSESLISKEKITNTNYNWIQIYRA